MNWFVLSLCSISALALAELTQQHILNSKNSIEERTSAILTFLVQAIFTIPIILISDLRYQLFDIFRLKTLVYLLPVNFIASIAMIYYLRSFKVKNISLSTILVSFSAVVSTALGIYLFSESFNFYKILGIGLILTAIISLNIKNLQIEKNHLWGLLAGLLFGITYTIDKRIVIDIHPVIYIFWGFTFVSLFGFLFKPKTVIGVVKSTKLSDYRPIIISGIGYFLYNLFTFSAYRVGGEVGRIDAINNSQVFLIILFEYFIFKNKEGVYRKLLTALIAFAGVMILGFT